MQEGYIDIRRILQHLVRECRAGRDDLHHRTMRQSLRFRIADLFGNRDLKPLCNKTRNIAVSCMIRHAAHGIFFEVAAAARERQPKLLCRNFCVIKEHLIEIAKPKKEQFVWMRLFRAQILHHRRDVLRVHNAPPKSTVYALRNPLLHKYSPY